MTRLHRRSHLVDGTTLAVAGLLLAILLWQGARYISLVARIGEWQFGHWDRYWPTATAGLPILLGLALVGLVSLLVRRVRNRRAQVVPPLEQQTQRLALIDRRLSRIFTVMAIVGAAGTVYCVYRVITPPVTGTVAMLSADFTTSVAGPARLAAQPDQRRVARLDQSVVLANRELLIAPLMPARNGPVRYFVELVRDPARLDRWAVPTGGYLRRAPIIHQLAAPFRSVSVTVAADPYLLYASRASLQWADFASAWQCALFGLISLAFSLLFRRRYRRLDTWIAAHLPTPVGI